MREIEIQLDAKELKKKLDIKDGAPGRDGVDGKDGRDGKDGQSIPGSVGPKGDKGDSIPGRDGKDGSPDSPDQVVEKVNAAKKLISPVKVKGLSDLFSQVEKYGSNPQGAAGGGPTYRFLQNGTTISEHVTELNFASNLTGTYDGNGRITLASVFTFPSLTAGSVLFSNGTTIAQDNANFFWDDTNNRLGLGTTTPTALLDVNGASIFRGTPTFQDVNPTLVTAVAGNLGYIVQSNIDGTGLGGQNVFQRSGGTTAAPTATLSAMSLGSFSFRGYTGSGYTGSKAFISAAATQNWSTTANGTRLAFSTTPNDSTTLTSRLVIDNSGFIGIGSGTAPTSLLHISSAPSSVSWGARGIFFATEAATATDTTGSGTVTTRVANSFGIPTLASTNVVTLTNAATLYVAGVPVAGTNTTITNGYSVFVNAGSSWFGGDTNLSLATGPFQYFRRADTTVNSADSFGGLNWQTNDAQVTTQTSVASIEVQAAATFTTDAVPTKMIFRTGSTTVAAAPVDRMTIDQGGNVGIGLAPVAKLDVLGTGTTSSTTTFRLADSASRSMFEVNDAGFVGMSIAPSSLWKLDFVGQYFQMGSDSTSNNLRTTNTTKLFGIVTPHYDNTQNPVWGIGVQNTSAGNNVNIGGGISSGTNAATSISLVTASTTTGGIGTTKVNLSGTILRIGSGDVTSTPAAVTLNGPRTGGIADTAGTNWTTVSGLATGTANSGDHIWQTGTIGSTGTTIQTATTRMTLKGGTGFLGIGTTTPDNLLHPELSGAATSSIGYPLRLTHITSGTATTGFGVGQEFEAENASGTNRVVGSMTLPYTDATNATEDADLVINLIDSGTLSERLRLTSDGIAQLRAGLATGKVLTVGGKVKDFYTDAGNGTTVETDLYSYTTEANLLGTNGDSIDARYAGIFVSSGTATRQLKCYFGGTVIFDSGALSISLSADWDMEVAIIRVDATTIRASVKLNTTGASASVYADVTETTGLTLSGTNVLKITGQAAGVGAATNDIVAKLGVIRWEPASI